MIAVKRHMMKIEVASSGMSCAFDAMLPQNVRSCDGTRLRAMSEADADAPALNSSQAQQQVVFFYFCS